MIYQERDFHCKVRNGWIGCVLWVMEEGGDQGVCVCVCVWMGRCDMEDPSQRGKGKKKWKPKKKQVVKKVQEPTVRIISHSSE